MSDQEAKTKTIGYLPIERVQTLKGWDEYQDKSIKLSVLRTETQKAKNSVREFLKERLNESGEIDFVTEGDRIRVLRVFRKQQPGRRAKSLDLSSSLREETDDAEQPTVSLDPTTEEFSANLDPVTERLMAIMKAKA
jgi:predicted ATPase